MKKAFSRLFLFILGSVVTFTAFSQSIDTTRFYVITSMQLGAKLALTGMVDATLGNKVMLRSVSDHPMQQWIFEQQKLGYRIYCREYGRAYSLEVVNEGSNSNKVSLGKTIEAASGQIWRVNKASDGSHIFISLWQDKAMDVVKSGPQINQLTLKETDNALDNPKWQLTGTPKPKQTAASAATVVITTPKEVVVQKSKNVIKPLLDTAKRYRIMTEEMPDKSIGVESKDGRTINPVLLQARTEAAQMWKISMNANGFYQFTNAEWSKKILGIRKSDGESQEVVFSDDRTGSEQFWKIVKAPEGGYQITSPVLGAKVSLDFVEDGEEVNAIEMRGFNSTLWMFIPLASTNAVTQPVEAAPTTTNRNKLMPGEQLKVNQKIFSANGAYSLVQQEDGNLVVYDSQNTAIWSSGLKGPTARRCIMQEDGNLTQHPAGYNQVLWSTQTKGNKGAYALLQDDGVLTVVNQNNQIIWRSMAAKAKTPAKAAATTQTASAKSGAAGADRLVAEQELLPTKFITSANGKYKLIQQEDGNLVIYQGNRPTWSTGTNGRKIQRCVMQKDGNLVLYDIFKDAVWASNTHGNEFAYLVLQDNGNLVLYSSGGAVLWETRTGQ
jgi:hypothetical protein